MEKKFPKAGVRFIAINNGYDSRKQENGISNIFQNVFDDYDSEENSKKIRRALLQLKKEGKYMAPVTPYGYQRDPVQPYHLIVDQEAAEVVKLIFQMRCEGKSGGEIARYLNSKHIPSPRDYKNGKKGEHIWQSEVIWKMVHNREYLGNLVAGKYNTTQTGSHKQRLVSSKQWIEKEAVHEAIIDRKSFEQAQTAGKVMQKDFLQSKKAKNKSTSYLRGLVICSGCGHKMKRREQKNPFFFCKYYYYNRNPRCLKAGIKEKRLLHLIRQILIEKIGGIGWENLYQQYKERFLKRQRQKKRKEYKLEKQLEWKQYFLYEKWKAGLIGTEDYQYGRERCKRDRDDFKEKMAEEIEEGGDVQKLEEVGYEEFLSELLRELVAGILIDSTGQIQIRFRFRT